VRAPGGLARHADTIVRCRVAGGAYAFEGRDVRFIARSDQVAPGGDGIGRVGTLRGREPIPVFALGSLLHPSADGGEGAHVVITGSGEDRAGWQVDRILRAPDDAVTLRLALPAMAGPLARRWFSAIVAEEDGAPSLVCAPAGLDPRVTAQTPLAALPPPPAGLPPNGAGRGVVVLFSSAALPACGASRFAIAGSRVVAVVQSLPTRAVPGTPNYVSAVAAWRDLAIPVLDLSGGAGVPPDSARGRHLIVRHGVAPHTTVTAIPIDRDVVLHRASQDDARLERPDGVPEGVELYAVRGEAVALVDLDSLTASCAA
jgi:chemotaxis signal transduction protein